MISSSHTDSDAATQSATPGSILATHQTLPTSGARAVLPFELAGQLYLVVPQLAQDVAGEPANMNGGDSDVGAMVYRWRNGKFDEHQRLPVPGGEDAAQFQIGDDHFLATASVRTGHGPYDLNATSTLFKLIGDQWEPFQAFETFAAKQWHYFCLQGRHFLALAQGVTIASAVARHPRQSCIYVWNGERFELFQTLEGGWGYNWAFFELAGHGFLAYADHTSVSRLYIWDTGRFAPFQDFAEQGGRAFKYFEVDGQSWLAFAAIAGESVLYRWAGSTFVRHQSLGGPGGREFEVIQAATALYLIRICFIEGSPAAPKTALLSDVYCWRDGAFVSVATFPTFGGTDAAFFHADGGMFLAVANSLTPDIRFRQDTMIYRLRL